jgi:hypothetical protein
LIVDKSDCVMSKTVTLPISLCPIVTYLASFTCCKDDGK